jgi:hypothetical protein
MALEIPGNHPSSAPISQSALATALGRFLIYHNVPVPLMIIVVAAVVAMMTSFSVASMVNARQQPGSKFGTIASLQNGKDGKPAWILSGAWDLKNVNSTSPTFNATFNMVMLNGSRTPQTYHNRF